MELALPFDRQDNFEQLARFRSKRRGRVEPRLLLLDAVSGKSYAAAVGIGK
jgi:hypothetical protein